MVLEAWLPRLGRCPAHLLHQQALELPPAVLHALAVSAVHHPDEAIRALEVVPPVGPQGLLATHVPDVQLEPGQEGGRWREAQPGPSTMLPAPHQGQPSAGSPLTLGVPRS